MNIEIKNIDEGGHDLEGKLYFTIDGGNKLVLNQKSALNIAWTLFDSLGMLNEEAQAVMYIMEDKIENDK